MKRWLISLVILTACASSPPPRDFVVKIFAAFPDTQTIEYEHSDGSVEVLETREPDFANYVCMTPEEYKKERVYQELLIKSCKEWR